LSGGQELPQPTAPRVAGSKLPLARAYGGVLAADRPPVVRTVASTSDSPSWHVPRPGPSHAGQVLAAGLALTRSGRNGALVHRSARYALPRPPVEVGYLTHGAVCLARMRAATSAAAVPVPVSVDSEVLARGFHAPYTPLVKR
jgi:hypothetical protein